MTSGVTKDWNQRDYQDVDQNQHGCKCQPQVAENFDRDMPLTIPLHGQTVRALGHRCALVLLYRIAIGQFDLVDGRTHLHDGVYRALSPPATSPVTYTTGCKFLR